MTKMQVRAVFALYAEDVRGVMLFPCRCIPEALGTAAAAFAQREMQLDCSAGSTHYVGFSDFLRIAQQEDAPSARCSTLDTVVRYMYAPDTWPNLELPYAPVSDLRRAEDDVGAAEESIRDKVTPEEWSVLEDAISAYGAASEIAAFDRGFRQGAQMVLQLIQSNAQPIPAM